MGSRRSHREDHSARLLSHFKTRTERNHTERRSHLFISKQILHRHNNLRIGVEFYRTSKVRHRSHTIDWRRPPSLSKKLISTNQIHRLGSRRQNIRPILVKTGRRQNNNRKNICSHYPQTMVTTTRNTANQIGSCTINPQPNQFNNKRKEWIRRKNSR